MAPAQAAPPRPPTPPRGSDRARARPASLETTSIPGLVVLRLDLREDARGWFKENWQREKMVALGLPDFGPVQNNVSFNSARRDPRHPHRAVGQVRLASRPAGSFGAWVDMREGDRSVRRSHRDRTRPSRSSCRAASATATRPSRTASPTPTWSTSTGGPATPTPRSTSPTRPWRSRGRSRSPRPRSPRRTSQPRRSPTSSRWRRRRR